MQPAFAPLVEAYVREVRAELGAALDSVYLYGSIPRGTAREGVSDLDGQVLLTRPPTDADRAAVERVEERLAAAYPVVSGVEILVDSKQALVDPADRWDGGFHVRVLCTPFWGPDAGAEVAPHVPGLELARGVQGDWRGALTTWRARAASAEPGSPEAQTVCRKTGRRLARVAFSWVLPRWGGWSSDPAVMADVVRTLEPGWAAPLDAAVRLGWGGAEAADLDAARALLAGWAVELTTRGDELGA